MKCSGKHLVCLLCLLAVSRPIGAVTNDADPAATPAPAGDETSQPYSAIWLRNVFDLKPTPKFDLVPPEKPPQPSNVKLTGLTVLSKIKRALFLVTKPPEPGKPPSSPISCILAEGERKEGLEVLEINLAKNFAKIKLDGEVRDIDLETNKPAANGPGNMAGGPPRPGFLPPQPGMNPAALPFSGGGPIPRETRSTVSPQTGGIQPNFGGGYAGASTTTPGLSLPNAFTQAPSAQQNTQQETAPPEVTAAILLAQRAAAASANRPYPPPPPPLDVPMQDPGASSGTGSLPAVPTAKPTLPPGFRPVFTGTMKQ